MNSNICVLTGNDRYLISQIKEFTTFTSLIYDRNVSLKDKILNIWLKLWEAFSYSQITAITATRRLETRLILQYARMHKDSTIYQTIENAKQLTDVIEGNTNGYHQSNSENELVEIWVSSKDVAIAALEAHRQGHKVAVIDLASAVNVCGAYLLPYKGTQEEKIAETVPLTEVLDRSHNLILEAERPSKDFKMFIPERGCLYLEDLPVFRKENGALNQSGALPLIDVIAVAALDGRDENIRAQYFTGNDLNEEGKKATKEKMRAVLIGAKEHLVEHLILGALGCGAYKNPPVTIANLWKEVIDECDFTCSYLKSIEFAIYVTSRPQDQLNFNAFQEVFSS